MNKDTIIRLLKNGDTQNVIEQLESGSYDWVSWCDDDVLSVCPWLTEEQAKEVLRVAVDQHDAELGLNWECFTCAAESLGLGEPEGYEALEDDE